MSLDDHEEETIGNALARRGGSAHIEELVEDTLCYPQDIVRVLRRLGCRRRLDRWGHHSEVQRPKARISLQVANKVAVQASEILGALHRPQPRVKFDQCYATTETTVRRFLYLFNRGDLHKKRVLFLGDDDLVAIPVGLARITCALHVLDIDKRVISLIGRLAKKNGFEIARYEYDLRKGLPRQLNDLADVVITDPPYTAAGLELFLTRACQALRKRIGTVCYIAYSSMDLAGDDIRRLQRTALQMGFMITDAVPGFNRYHPRSDMKADAVGFADTSSPWFRSSWIRLEAVTPPLRLESELAADIYAYS